MGISTPKTATQIDKFINTDFDAVQTVANNIEALVRVSDSISEVINNIKVKYTAIPNGLTVDFSNKTTFTSGSIQSILWDFGDATTSTDSDVSHVYVSAGTYVVTLTIEDDLGSTNQLSHEILVQLENLAPVVNFTETISYNEVTFTSLAADGDGSIAGYKWEFGDGNAALIENPIYLYRAEGNYTVRLTVTDNRGLAAYHEHAVVVNVLPEFDIAPRCNFTTDAATAERNIQFTDDSMGVEGYTVVGWLWTFADGSSSTEQHPLHVFATSGSYDVILAVTDDNGRQAICNKTVAAFMLPISIFTDADVGRELTFTDVSTSEDGTINSWLWDFGDTNSSTLQNPVHTYALAGSYDVKLTVGNALGDYAESTRTLSVNALPVPSFTYAITNGELDATFTDTSVDANGTVASWLWDFGDTNTSTLQNPSHTYATTGDYTVTLSITDDLGDSSLVAHSVVVAANLKPVASFDIAFISLTYTFTDTSTDVGGAVVAWSWNFGDGTPLVSTQNPVHTYATDADYDVTLIVTDDKGATHFDTQTVQARDIVYVDGTTGNDALVGTSADETIRMFDGDDTFTYTLGDGKDTIDATGLGTKAINIVGIQFAEMTATRTNARKDLTLTMPDGGSLFIPDYYIDNGDPHPGANRVDTISTSTEVGNPIDVALVEPYNASFSFVPVLFGSPANTNIYTSRNGTAAVIPGVASEGTGVKRLYNANSNGAHDVVHYRKGDGAHEYSYSHNADTANHTFEIVFGAGITLADIVGSETAPGDAKSEAILTMPDGDVIQINDYERHFSLVSSSPTKMTFADGVVLNQADFIALVRGQAFLVGTNAGETLTVATEGTTRVMSLEGNDTIVVTNSVSDTLVRYDLNDGDLAVNIYNGVDSYAKTNELIFGEGITADDLQISSTGAGQNDDVSITIASTGETITYTRGMTTDYTYGPDPIRFHDGSTLTEAQWKALIAVYGTTGDDVINNPADGSTVYLLSGNDRLNKSSAGHITIHHSVGDDIVDYFDNSWTANRTYDLVLDNVNSPSDLVASFVGTGANASVKMTHAGGSFEIIRGNNTGSLFLMPQTTTFLDGTVLDRDGVMAIFYQGTAGDDVLTGTGSGNVIDGLAGNDTINAGGGDNTVTGGLGDDTITTGAGASTFHYAFGDGNDTIELGSDGSDIHTNVLQFGAGIYPYQVAGRVSGADVYMDIYESDATTLSATIKIVGGVNYDKRIEEYKFATSGETIPWTIMNTKPVGNVIMGTEGVDSSLVVPDGQDTTVFALGGGDTIQLGVGSHTVEMYMGTGNDAFYEGDSGFTGTVNIHYELGDGDDAMGSNGTVSGTYNLIVGEGINPDNAVVTLTGVNNDTDLLITFAEGGSFKVSGHKSGRRLDSITWFNGAVWNETYITDGLYRGTDADDTWYDIDNKEFHGNGGDDYFTRNDNAVYHYKLGDGNDRIGQTNAGGTTKVMLDASIAYADCVFTQVGDDIYVTFPDAGSIQGDGFYTGAGYEWALDFNGVFTMTAQDMKDAVNGLFIVGTAAGETLSDTAGNNTILGLGGNDTINAGSGSNVIIGGQGDDIINSQNSTLNEYHYTLGDGNDDYTPSYADDVEHINLHGIQYSDAVWTTIRDGKDYLTTFPDGGSVRVYSAVANLNNTRVHYRFVDDNNLVITPADMDAVIAGTFVPPIYGTAAGETITGTAESESIFGLGGNDTIDGGLGDDDISGGEGNDWINSGDAGHDIIRWNVGDGRDTIDYRHNNGDATFEIAFGAGVTPADFTYDIINITGVIRYLGTDVIYVQNWTDTWRGVPNGFAPTRMTFENGYVMTRQDFVDAMNGIFVAPIFGTTGSETISSPSGNQKIYPLAGNDSIHKSAAGHDTIYIGRDDGTNTLDYHRGTNALDRTYEVVFGDDITIDEIVGSNQGTGDNHEGYFAIPRSTSGNDYLTMRYYARNNFQYTPTQVTFSDGLVIGKDDIIKIILGTYVTPIVGTENADTLNGTVAGANNEDIYGLGGNDTIVTGNGPEQAFISGGAGDDNIWSKGNGNVIEGGTGDDTIRRQSDIGHDIIRYNLGDGFDTIDWNDGVSGDSVAKTFEIVFGAGISPNDLTGRTVGSYEHITLSGTDIMRFYQWFAPHTNYRPQKITFADGYVMTQANYDELIAGTYVAPTVTVLTGSTTAVAPFMGTAGDDNITSNEQTNYIRTAGGNDVIHAGSGTTFVRMQVAGHAVVHVYRNAGVVYCDSYDGVDVPGRTYEVVFHDIQSVEATAIAASGGSPNNLSIRINGNQELVTMQLAGDQGAGGVYAAEQVTWGDGEVWDKATLYANFR